MEIAIVATRPLLTKLGDLLVGEFTLENRVRKGIESLVTELTLMHATLRKVAKVPHEQLDEGVKIWAGNVKELSYHMEDIIDAFMVRVEDEGEPANPTNKVKKVLKKTIKLFKKGKNLRRISDALEDVLGHAKQLAELHQRYEQEMCITHTGASVDPRVVALYTDATELVGIEETLDAFMNMLNVGDDLLNHPLKMVSIVGFGGLGKMTLAKIAFDKIKVQFDCGAFVSVSQNPDAKKVFKNILYELDKEKYADIHNTTREDKHLIDELIEFLTNKRYLIVVDDIWDQKLWQLIKCAFPKRTHGSRLITTTRIVSVSEACCFSSDDIYKMEPLSNDVSRRLFNKRVFSHENGCPSELVQVSEDILQKCGGIPLAIITIASLLSSDGQIKVKVQWYALLSSIGRGLTDDRCVEEMKKILLFSYYDLPSYLKPCLLYLSIFPEDHEIIRSKLIWMWISEGFIHSAKQETSLYEVGDSYFNELVNRSMIQPIGIDNEEKVEACRVHDMVLDLICSLASEENFVTILDGVEKKMPNSHSKVRRLSIQNSKVDVATISMAQVRSFSVFTDNIVDQVLNISRFQVLRVLDLEGCTTILDIGNAASLLHMRYLALTGVSIGELPIEIGKLHFLQTLDLRRTWIKELPSSIVRLRCLMYLNVNSEMKLPFGIGSMTSLEVLQGLSVGQVSSGNLNLHVVKEMGSLTKLRVLRFLWKQSDESLDEALVASLNNLHKLEILDIYAGCGRINLMREGWVPSLQLRRFKINGPTCWFPTLPAWVNPSSVPLLSYLFIRVDEVRSEDIRILGMLPTLRYLQLCGDKTIKGEDALEMLVADREMSNYIHCGPKCHLLFPRGAAPRLKQLHLTFPAMWISRGDFDLGMEHLPSLENVEVMLLEDGATNAEVKEANGALRAVVDSHPNRPKLTIYIATKSLGK